MMKQVSFSTCLQAIMGCFIAILVVGCADTTIYPEANNTYSLVTTSGKQGYAEKDALKKSSEYCNKTGKKLVVLSHQTAYHGVEKTNAALIGLASLALTARQDSIGGNPATSNQDYEVTMKFTCQ